MIACALGCVAMYAWVQFIGFFALYALEPTAKWLFNIGIKGGSGLFLFVLIESIIFAAFCAAILRAIFGRRWTKPSVAFCVAFAALFYIPSLEDGPFSAAFLSL